MALFKDAMGRKWLVELDGPTMGEIRDKAKVDLADLSGNGYLKIEADSPSLVAALTIICRDAITRLGITPAQFAKQIRKDALTDAAAAVLSAAADFFPTKQWSETLSRCESARKMKTDMAGLMPILTMLDEPGIPSRMKDAIMEAISEEIKKLGGSSGGLKSLAGEFAVGSTATQSTPATDLPASAEFDPAV